MTTDELAYRVITIDKKGFLGVRSDEDSLTTATAKELKIAWLDGATIVDSNGMVVRVRAAKSVSGKGRFWGYYSPFLDRIVKVQLALDRNVSDMPLEELKKQVIGNWRRFGRATHPDYYRQQLQYFGEARSVRELIERFQPHMDMKEFYERLGKFSITSIFRLFTSRY